MLAEKCFDSEFIFKALSEILNPIGHCTKGFVNDGQGSILADGLTKALHYYLTVLNS